jgi:hypothetical protein
MLCPDAGEFTTRRALYRCSRCWAGRGEAMLSDEDYDADVIREKLTKAGVEALIPSKSNSREQNPHDR